MRRLCVAAAATALLLTSACSTPEPAALQADELAARVSADAIFAHLERLAAIADDNANSRAVGTAGYDATVEYISEVLRDNGFEISTPEFEWLKMGDPGNPTLEVAGRSYPVTQASPLASTPRGGLSGLSLRPRTSDGCERADYGNVRGALAIVDDTGCSVVVKQNAAAANGAVGLLVISAGGTKGLFEPGYYQKLTMPVAVIDRTTDAALRRTNDPVRLVLDGQASVARSKSVIAQTSTGDTGNVVLAGAHLDSAPRSPGINDNGSGVAALLAIADAMGSAPRIDNAVRFTFWGSQRLGAAGKYLAGLDDGGRADIAAYLDATMIGSPNPGYFTLDGDQSGQANPAIPADTVPEGSAGIERTLAGYLNQAGVRPADMPLDTAGDYAAFLNAGVPVGGLTTGANQQKTPVQARLWGGRAGAPFDPNAGGPRDGMDNVDHRALSITGPAMAFTIATYARSIEGVNGVPPRDRRNR
ncbi:MULTISPECIES: M28 family peptidase [Mycolicibacterium]|uniref:Aminopeptidase n=1 Tax=Mycolicibacterium neoaurum TaxID=1795 RepID=A0AAV2WES4_MYCNE|nr:M28 family peptidase [Mycolicibacterium neoaurum]TLH59278.1 peptidase M28 [Mycolicibacterium neoaurum]CDQ42625.1 putative aminopeptidase [Mycolicibacterium neoaurum]